LSGKNGYLACSGIERSFHIELNMFSMSSIQPFAY
jgi:hypothetical protein